jgi:hypothetical protein
LDMAPGMLLTNLAVEPVGAAQLLPLSYTDTNPYRAKEIVNTVGRVSSERITGMGSEKLPPTPNSRPPCGIRQHCPTPRRAPSP